MKTGHEPVADATPLAVGLHSASDPSPFWVKGATSLYTVAATAAAHLVAWWYRRSGRWSGESIRQRRGEALPAALARAPIWIHAASMGEARVGGFFAGALHDRGKAVMVSAMTEPGHALCCDLFPVDTACIRVPFDLPQPIRRVLAHFHPQALVLVETEWWPNLLLEAARAAVPVFVINGRLSDRAYRRYRISARYWRHILERVAFFYMRSEQDAQRLMDLGIDSSRIVAAGLLKAGVPVPIPGWEGLVNCPEQPSERPIWVAGCTRPGEEPIVLEAFHAVQSEIPDAQLWLAPRHPERFTEVAGLVEQAGFRCSLWSEGNCDGNAGYRVGVIVVDRMGVLAQLYGRAQVAFVGGSLRPYGGHNPLEPALAGAQVVFGPHMDSQTDASAILLDAHLAVVAHDAPSLAAAVVAGLRVREDVRGRVARMSRLHARFLRVRNDIADDLLARLARERHEGSPN